MRNFTLIVFLALILREQHKYRAYQKECQDFKHLQLGNENRYYDDAGTCTLIINSNSSTDTSSMSIPTVVNGQQL
jgi:hypothetical protein